MRTQMKWRHEFNKLYLCQYIGLMVFGIASLFIFEDSTVIHPYLAAMMVMPVLKKLGDKL